MGLFDTFHLDTDKVNKVVADNWLGGDLGTLIKASQNQTFKGSVRSTLPETSEPQQVVFRVCRYTQEKFNHIEAETLFLNYLKSQPELGNLVCNSVPAKDGSRLVYDKTENVVIVAFEFAHGEAVEYSTFEWLSNSKMIEGVGRWLGLLHNASEKFAHEHPDVVSRLQSYEDNLGATLKGVPVHEEDELAKADTHKFGVLHGDINPTNFFYNFELDMPVVFDWDQVQRGWFAYDIAQPTWGVIMISTQSPPPAAIVICPPAKHAAYIMNGYRQTRKRTDDSFEPMMDYNVLKRMLLLRKQQYDRFCRKAIVELEAPQSTNEPNPGAEAMRAFCKFVIEWIDSGVCDIDAMMGDEYADISH